MHRLAMRIFGGAAVVAGVLGIAFGSFWASRALDAAAHSPAGWVLELWVPFLPIFLISLGALAMVRSGQ